MEPSQVGIASQHLPWFPPLLKTVLSSAHQRRKDILATLPDVAQGVLVLQLKAFEVEMAGLRVETKLTREAILKIEEDAQIGIAPCKNPIPDNEAV